MNTPSELSEQLRESRKETRQFWALDSIADILTCQDDEEEDEDEDPEEEGDEQEDEEDEEDGEEGEVDKYYLDRRSSVIGDWPVHKGRQPGRGSYHATVAT
jgi:hypothetical protein